METSKDAFNKILDAAIPYTYSLHRITKFPVDITDEFYLNYPAVKLGVTSAVTHYAKLIVPIIRKVMSGNPRYNKWILTSPPYDKLPGCPNLVCWKVHELLSEEPDIPSVEYIDLHGGKPDNRIKSQQEFNNYNNYSSYGWEERIKIKGRDIIIMNRKDFENKGLIFINDINVTGTDMFYMLHSFGRVYDDTPHFIYIIDCEREVGRTHPHLESYINNYTINTVEDFGNILKTGDLTFTSKSVSKIFTYDEDDTKKLISMLSDKTKSMILEMIEIEKRYSGDFFKDKIELIKGLCD